MTVNKTAIPALMKLYHQMRDPKYKSEFASVASPRIEWVGQGPKAKSFVGIGKLLFDSGIDAKALSVDEKLLSSLHYCCQVINRYADNGGIYIKELDESLNAVHDYFQPVFQSVGLVAEPKLIGYQFADTDGKKMKALWQDHPKGRREILQCLALNIYEGYPLPSAARAFLFEWLTELSDWSKPSRGKTILDPPSAETTHRDYLLRGLAKRIRSATSISVGANESKLASGNSIPVCGASIATAAMNVFGVTLAQRTGIRDTTKNTTSFQIDALASKILAPLSWNEKARVDSEGYGSADDLSVRVEGCLNKLSCTL